jgi:hypothetical protein
VGGKRRRSHPRRAPHLGDFLTHHFPVDPRFRRFIPRFGMDKSSFIDGSREAQPEPGNVDSIHNYW